MLAMIVRFSFTVKLEFPALSIVCGLIFGCDCRHSWSLLSHAWSTHRHQCLSDVSTTIEGLLNMINDELGCDFDV